jgi:hypothetical protein
LELAHRYYRRQFNPVKHFLTQFMRVWPSLFSGTRAIRLPDEKSVTKRRRDHPADIPPQFK